MLSQLLEMAGGVALSFPVDADMLQLLQVLEPSEDDTIFISALPPFAFSHARTLSHKLRAVFRSTRIVVGVWGFPDNADTALERFQSPRPDQLVTTLEQAVAAVGALTAAPAELS